MSHIGAHLRELKPALRSWPRDLGVDGVRVGGGAVVVEGHQTDDVDVWLIDYGKSMLVPPDGEALYAFTEESKSVYNPTTDVLRFPKSLRRSGRRTGMCRGTSTWLAPL